MRYLLLLAAALFALPSQSAGPHKAIEEAFARIAAIKSMNNGPIYELPAGGKPMRGKSDDFLRRRTGAEVLASGLSSGCGDYAVAFIHLMEERGFHTMLVDSAEISTPSLRSNFSGHAVVAVRDGPRWILADPTRRQIISENWSPSDKMFDDRYWIGFRGPLSEYPAHDPESLRQFYKATLKTIPPEVLNQRLVRLRFTVDASLVGPDKEYLNPNLAGFLQNNGKFLESLGIRPEKEIPVLLVKGGDDYHSDVKYSAEAGWVCALGRKSSLSPSFVSFLERAVTR